MAQVEMEKLSASVEPFRESKVKPDDHLQGVCSNTCCDDNKAAKQMSAFDVVKAGLLVPLQTLVEVHGVDILNRVNEDGETLAHWACLRGNKVILRYIIDVKGSVNEPTKNEAAQRPIHWACVNGHVTLVDILLQHNVSVDTKDGKGFTPLIVAAQYGQTMLAAYLIGKGASLYVTDLEGDTALHWAASKGHSELMRMLIYLGFNPNQPDNWGQMPLHLACINGNLTAVQELCEVDHVDTNVADKRGKTPLMLATGRKHTTVIAYLKKESSKRSSLLPQIDFWSIVFGPPGNSKNALLFIICNLLFIAYPVYILKCIPMTWLDLELFHIIFFGMNVIMWISLYCSSTIDPGFLPQNIPEYDETLQQIANCDTWQQGTNPLNKLCHTCRTVKPVRSKHCRTCNRCVLVFDHHCPYIYNCVGFNNRVWFMTFVCAVVIMSLMGDYFIVYMLWMGGWDWIVGFVFVEIGFCTLISVPVFMFTLYQTWINITTNERQNWKRYKYLQDGKGRYYNPFDQGVKLNFLEFLHLQPPPAQKDVEFLNVTVI